MSDMEKVMKALEHIEKHASEAEVRQYWKNTNDGRIEERYEFWVRRNREEVN